MPQYGNSGLSAIPAVVCSFNESLVRVAEDRPRLKGKRFAVVSPLCGKSREFRKYLLSLDRLPLEHAHAVIYDNSNDRVFHRRLVSAVRDRFQSYRIIVDQNEPVFVKQGQETSVDRMREITQRIADVYGYLYREHVPKRLPFVFNLEDDVEVPAGGFEKLLAAIEADRRIGTVIGTCCDRRRAYGATGSPIAFRFLEHRQSGFANPDSVDLVPIPEKTFGIEAIGGGHSGCWLTRKEALAACPFGEAVLHGIYGHDIIWGWRLQQAGFVMANDWSVRCRHWFTERNRLASV